MIENSGRMAARQDNGGRTQRTKGTEVETTSQEIERVHAQYNHHDQAFASLKVRGSNLR